MREDPVWRPAHPAVPDSAVSVGPRLCALAVYLLVFQHVPVKRCRLLLSDMAGADRTSGYRSPIPPPIFATSNPRGGKVARSAFSTASTEEAAAQRIAPPAPRCRPRESATAELLTGHGRRAKCKAKERAPLRSPRSRTRRSTKCDDARRRRGPNSAARQTLQAVPATWAISPFNSSQPTPGQASRSSPPRPCASRARQPLPHRPK